MPYADPDDKRDRHRAYMRQRRRAAKLAGLTGGLTEASPEDPLEVVLRQQLEAVAARAKAQPPPGRAPAPSSRPRSSG